MLSPLPPSSRCHVMRKTDCRIASAWRVTLLLFALVFVVALPTTLVADDPIQALRERYLGPTGLPSETAYAQAHGIQPIAGSESGEWDVTFKFTYRTADLTRLNAAEPVHTDCHFTRRRKYIAPARLEPVWDARVYPAGDRLVVAAFTPKGERIFGHVDEQGAVARDKDADKSVGMMDLSNVKFNPFTAQLWRPGAGGKHEEQQHYYLPIGFANPDGRPVYPELKVSRTGRDRFALVARSADQQVAIATCAIGREGDSKRSRGYMPVLGPGCVMTESEPTTVLEIRGSIDRDVLDIHGPQLVLKRDLHSSKTRQPRIEIDGRFDEWRNIRGITDPEGDIVSYLQHNPDTDLLEFKVTNDDEYLYFYTRVAGRHGNTAEGRDRYYFYVYIDADRNPATGYRPTRDDDCYYGVTLGDDCEAQFEFIGGRFVKTFFGFAGRSTEQDVLSGRVALGPSWYNRHDERGRLRDGYKVEYIRRGGEITITEDSKDGTSDDIAIALSPDGSECEMRAALSGFLRDRAGKPIIAPGQRIDLAAGVEASGQARGNSKWGADSTVAIRGYSIDTETPEPQP
jgi:hypothetical protein